MAEIKNLNDGIIREPEAPGAEIERKEAGATTDPAPATAAPKTAGAAPRDERPLPDPFKVRRSDAPSVAGKTPRPTQKPGE